MSPENKPSRNEITLVIDDSPSYSTGTLLSRLEAAGHRAVLFVLGMRLAGRGFGFGLDVLGRRAMLVRVVRRGFALGNHSFAHPHFSQIDIKEAKTSIERTDRLIDDIYDRAGVRRPGKWFRFPYLDTGGKHSSDLQSLLRDLGFECPHSITPRLQRREPPGLDWPSTLCTMDWQRPPVAVFRERLRKALPGDVIEVHDRRDTVRHYSRVLVEELSNLSLRAAIPAGGRADLPEAGP